MAQYLAYLKQAKTWSNSKREQITSKKLTASSVFINKFPWVDSTHKNSEIKSYISRYAGTVCCKNTSSKLGILVVLSAHQDHYKKYSAGFVKTVNSLRVMDIEKALSKVRASQAAGSGAGMASYLEGIFDDASQEDLQGVDLGSKLLGLDLTQWAGLGAVLLILAYFMFKKRKRKGRPRSRRKK